jgi:hypothetical protein
MINYKLVLQSNFSMVPNLFIKWVKFLVGALQIDNMQILYKVCDNLTAHASIPWSLEN